MPELILNHIRDAKGQPIVLNEMEVHFAEHTQREFNAKFKDINNSLGFELPITTLTGIFKKVSEQKFATIAPADYMPLRVGENSWSTSILTYRSYSIAGSFETGNLNVGANNSKLATADTGVDGVTVKVMNWGVENSWNVMELMTAARSGNWDLVTSKEYARKKMWDLGIQKTAFLGLADNSDFLGLFTQQDVNSNTAAITTYIKDMTATQFQTMLGSLLGAYQINCNYTAYPTHFIMPAVDFNGCANAVDENFGLRSRLERMEEALKRVTMNPNFQILPNFYADQANNIDTINLNRYTLLNYDETSVRMDIPVDYTSTLQNTINGFNFNNVGYGQYTGARAYRPLEMLYFDWS